MALICRGNVAIPISEERPLETRQRTAGAWKRMQERTSAIYLKRYRETRDKAVGESEIADEIIGDRMHASIAYNDVNDARVACDGEQRDDSIGET